MSPEQGAIAIGMFFIGGILALIIDEYWGRKR